MPERYRPNGKYGRRVGAVAAMLAMLAIPAFAAYAASGAGADTRSMIVLSAAESEEMRAGMRAFLESVERIVAGVSDNKMTAVAEGAKASGMGMINDVPFSIAAKLPPDFIVMATDTHQKFDTLAQQALDVGTKLVVMKHLSAILANCTSCHAMYRIAP